jgi:hypothetical protein
MPWWGTALGSLAVGGLGGLATVYGLSNWLGNLWLEKQKAKFSQELEEFKAKQYRQLEAFKDILEKEQKRVQARIDHSVLVTRAQFETEFAAMKELFKHLSLTRLLLAGIRPSSELSPPNETPDDRLKRLFRRVDELGDAYNTLITQMEETSPFYPEDVYYAVEECAKIMRWEMTQIRTGNREETFNPAWYRDGGDNYEKFMKRYHDVGRLIRDRISHLSILPSS